MRRHRGQWPVNPGEVVRLLADDLVEWDISFAPPLVIGGRPGQHVYRASQATPHGSVAIECVSPSDLLLYVEVLSEPDELAQGCAACAARPGRVCIDRESGRPFASGRVHESRRRLADANRTAAR